jgi:DNA-binding CsgD family transcriptional regulator
MAKRKKLVTGVFSKNEVKILKKMYRSTSTKEVAAKLGRKVKSVEVKASKLGLKKTKKYLKSMYGSR